MSAGIRHEKLPLLLVCFLLAWGVWLFLSLDALPYLDLTNHVARGCTISRLWTSDQPFYAREFTFQLEFYSYILSDLMFAGVCTVASPSVAGAVNMALGFILLPLAGWVYLRAMDKAYRLELLLLLMLYLSTNWHFTQGFLAYHMGISTTLFGLAALEMRRKHESKLWLIVFALAIAVCYLMHLASFVVLMGLWAVAAGRDLLRQRRIGRVWLETGAALAAVCLYQGAQSLLRPSDISGDGGIVYWRSISGKLLGVGTMFVRFSQTVDLGLFVLFVVILAWLGRRLVWPRGLGEWVQMPFVGELALMFGLYVVVPLGVGTTYHLDERFLPYAFVFLCLLVLTGPSAQEGSQRLALGLAMLLCTVNLAYLTVNFHEENDRGRAILKQLYNLPAGKRVLPVASLPNDGRMQAFNHLYGLYTPERAGLTPYIQGGDNKNPMRYFSYRNRPYAPDVFWYQRTQDSPQWDKIRGNYDLLFIAKPYDPARLDLAGSLDLWRSTPAADVYQVRQR